MKFIASYYSKAGKHLFSSSACDTREEAARLMFQVCQKAKTCSTSQAFLDGDVWRTMHKDIQWHKR